MINSFLQRDAGGAKDGPVVGFLNEGDEPNLLLVPIAIEALDAFGVVTYPTMAASPAGEIGRYYQLAPAIQFMSSGFVWHSDQETDATISPEGLAAVTRAYTKIVVESNKVDLAALRAK